MDVHNATVAEKDMRYVPFLKKCAERAGKQYPHEFAEALNQVLVADLEDKKESRNVRRILNGDKLPTRQFLEAAAKLAGVSLEYCIQLPRPWNEEPHSFPIVWQKETYYRLLTAIYESQDDYWIAAIEGNLYGMLIAAGQDFPPGVPHPPVKRKSPAALMDEAKDSNRRRTDRAPPVPDVRKQRRGSRR